ncbi:DHH family phosphoesterase ['Camptotheca acuminata' phytoplasma]|uniref:DHH family phosphoesterase n=1 Tax='Camptotheca acuminata' phytoplasma TaxID=3239192 RepID=UPI00351A7FF4
MKFIKKQIEKFDTIIIHGHKRPDGDCYGSQLGLKNMIQTTYPNKNVYVVGEEEPKISFLGKMDHISDDLYKEALVFVVDSAQHSVISDPRYKLSKMIIRIDHHLFIEKIGHYEWIDSEFASCSEMIYHLKEFNNFKLTKEGALPIYTGIVTDTGDFRFDRVDKKTLSMASSLLEYGFNVSDIDKQINSQSVNILKFKGFVCSNFVSEDGLIYFKFSEEMLKQFDLNVDTAFSIVNILSGAKPNLLWAFICELKSGNWKFSIRSHGPQISPIAHKFGGGGHERACGLIVKTADEVDEVIRLLKKSIQEFHKQNN